MAFEQKAGTVSIFRNDKKQSDKAPEYSGKLLTPSGEAFDISLWVRESNGKKFFSGTIKEPYVKQQPAQHNPYSIVEGKGTPLEDEEPGLPF